MDFQIGKEYKVSQDSQNVLKRDGRVVVFDSGKVFNAMLSAYSSLHDTIDKDYVDVCNDAINAIIDEYDSMDDRILSVEDIQDIVEDTLLDSKYNDVAKAYILYRDERTRCRETTIDRVVSEILEDSNEYWSTENSNKDSKLLTTQRDYMAGAISTDIMRRKILPKHLIEAHDSGILHIHDCDYISMKMYNCFHSKTEFVTSEGLKSFKDCYDGQIVTVKDKDGVWREATVRKYSKQPMQTVTLRAGRSVVNVVCTSNHRWVLLDGSVTTNLQVGDRLSLLQDSTQYTIDTKRQAEMFCLGFVLGDGVSHGNRMMVRLCGDKVKYRNIFERAGYRLDSYHFDNNDIHMSKKTSMSKYDFINHHMWCYLSDEDKAYVFRGLLSADGRKDGSSLSTSNTHICKLIEDLSCTAGYYISSVRHVNSSTNFSNHRDLYEYIFRRYQVVNHSWKVISIESYARGNEYNTWCVEEPVTHTFTLGNGIVTGNCCLINLEDMLQNGTVISNVQIDKPHKFSTACNIASQVIAQVASSQFGGQSISLSHVSPFVEETRKTFKKKYPSASDELIESMVRDDIRAGIQTLQYQVLTLMTTNGQAPFLTVFMNLTDVDGSQRDDLALCIQEMLEQRIVGVKNDKGVYVSPSFPKLIYALDECNITEDSPYFYLTQLSAVCSAKRLVPDYVSTKVIKQLKNGDVFPPMGCRSFLSVDTATENLAKAHNWDRHKYHTYYGRFNLGVVTLNLVDVALSANGDMGRFWDLMEERSELVHEAQLIRYHRLKGTKSDVAPILWQHGAIARLGKGETIDRLLLKDYATISFGYGGLYECCMAMLGESNTTERGQQFCKAVLQFINKKCDEWSTTDNLGFSPYGTPMESLTYRFAKTLRKRFGVIKDITDHDYITNSFHVNVREHISAFDKIAIESQFQELSLGGSIIYTEVPNMNRNIEAVVQLLQYMYEHSMYSEINTKSDYCSKCGFDGEIQIKGEEGHLYWECPQCGNTDTALLHVTRRTCGYLGSNFWNQGRTEEIRDRVLHLD